MARFPKGKGSAEAFRHTASMRDKKLGGGGGRSGCSVVPFFILIGASLMVPDIFL